MQNKLTGHCRKYRPHYPVLADRLSDLHGEKIEYRSDLYDSLQAGDIKVDHSSRALGQIKSRGYHEKYITSGDIYLVGINFDLKEKNITEFDWEKVNQPTSKQINKPSRWVGKKVEKRANRKNE